MAAMLAGGSRPRGAGICARTTTPRPKQPSSSALLDCLRYPVLFYAVVSDELEEAVELLPTREEAEAVQAWDREEPDQAGILRVEKIG